MAFIRNAKLCIVTIVIIISSLYASAETIYGCAHKQNGNFRIVSAPGQCHNSEYELSWVSGENNTQMINEFLSRLEVIENALGVINQVPSVYAGDDQTILLYMVSGLAGDATDDGLIIPLTFFWEFDSGPGTVYFSDPTSLLTTAEFSTEGLYGLRLTAYDGVVHVSDTLQIRVYPDNTPPTIEIPEDPQIVGAMREYNQPSISFMRCVDINLGAIVEDDDLPLPLNFEWAIVGQTPSNEYYEIITRFLDTPSDSIDWPLMIEARTRPNYQNVTLLPPVIRAGLLLSVNDGYWTTEDGMTVHCDVSANDPPVVSVEQNVVFETFSYPTAPAFRCLTDLTGHATDDGLPSELVNRWGVSSLPGSFRYSVSATFGSPNSLTTSAMLYVQTKYPYNDAYHLPDSVTVTFSLESSDGYYSESADVTVTCYNPL